MSLMKGKGMIRQRQGGWCACKAFKQIQQLQLMKQDWPTRDEHSQMFQHRFQIYQPQFRCLADHIVTNICTNKACKAESALMCGFEECPSCSEKHSICEQIKLKVVTKIVQEKVGIQRKLIMGMFEIEDEAIRNLQAARNQLIDQYCFGGLETKFTEIIQQLYFRQQGNNLKSNSARQFLDKLRQNQNGLDQVITFLRIYEQQTKNSILSLNKSKENLLHQFSTKVVKSSDQQIKKQPPSIILPKQPQNIKAPTFALDSKIVFKDNIEGLNFINHSLSYPKSLLLLYRASQYDFTADMFHKVCDNVPNTLTLILTQYKKIIGGFTPIPWRLAERYVKDEQKKSFIFSVTLQQKMNLVDFGEAVYHSAKCGPCFGKKDIYIYDRCDGNNRRSNSNFPKSYNFQKPYVRSQGTWKSFCGATNNTSFSVKEYEVFKVIW